MSPSRPIPLLVALATLAVAACGPKPAGFVDARAVLPSPDLRKDDYARHYFLTTAKTDADLPFTSGPSVSLAKPLRVWTAVYVRTPSLHSSAPAGVYVADRRADVPEVVHSGCSVVNLVADAATGETLGSWCNVDTDDPPPSRPGAYPPPLPTYVPDRSPLARTGPD